MAKFLDASTRIDIITKIMKDVPKRLDSDVIEEIQAKLVELMSPECRAVYHTTPEALRVEAIPFVTECWHRYVVGNLVPDTPTPELSAMLEPYKEAHKTRKDLRDKLTQMFDSVRTVVQLHTTFPDFKKYYPPLDAAETAKRKKKDELTTEELEALLEKKRKQEEAQAMKTVKSFGVASELSQLGWMPTE